MQQINSLLWEEGSTVKLKAIGTDHTLSFCFVFSWSFKIKSDNKCMPVAVTISNVQLGVIHYSNYDNYVAS